MQKLLVSFGLGFGLVACSTVMESPAKSTIPLKGNCGELGCEKLWRSLQNTWPDIFNELDSDCPVVESYGLNTWESNAQNQRLVSVICWHEQEVNTTETYGTFFRIFPYPGTENTFLADTNCGGLSECIGFWETLKENYPEEVRQMRQTCAFRQGSILLELDRDRPVIDLRCAFFVPSLQIDSDGDGIMDGESKPTSVDFSLGKLLLTPPQ